MRVMRVMEPGLLTTVQDLGRKGFRRFGMPVSGAVDSNSLQAANLLVGNAVGEPALELTMSGPEVEFCSSLVIGVTGADMDPRINGRPMPMWQACAVYPGDRLRFGWAKNGCRAYLAVAGGIDVPSVMGSKSTYIRGGIGGFKGRALLRGDCLPVGVPFMDPEQLLNRRIPSIHIPEFNGPWTIRVVPGPQADYFTAEGLRAFFGQAYRVTKDADRMGCRLEGHSIGHVAGSDIISDAVLPGSIQVPGNGCPIVMLTDCNTTGGYAKIATVIHSELWKIAQARPGDILRFVAVSVEEAHQFYNNSRKLTGCLTNLPVDRENGRTEDIFFVTAPLAGVYFRSSTPGSRPCVQTGEVIDKDRTIGFLEFMKLTLELKAGAGGEIMDILAQDRQMVKTGQKIVAIRREK